MPGTVQSDTGTLSPAGTAPQRPDKPGFELHFPTTILGLPVCAPNSTIPLRCLSTKATERKDGSYYLANVSFKSLLDAQADKDLYRCLVKADYLFPTGTPAHVAARCFGLSYRNAASHWSTAKQLMDYAEAHNLRLFLLGERPAPHAKVHSRLNQRRPKLQVVGEHWIWPGDWNKETAIQLNQTIRTLQPDIVFAALSCIQAKIWLAETAKTLASALVFDLGASEALFTRIVHLKAERRRYSWAYRIWNKIGRFPTANFLALKRCSQFGFRIFTQQQYLRSCVSPARAYGQERPFPIQRESDLTRIKLPERFDQTFLHRFRSEWTELCHSRVGIILDAANVSTFDLLVLGTLVHLTQILRKRGLHLVIQDPPLALVRYLQYAEMSKVLSTRYNASAAEDLARSATWDHPKADDDDSETIFWRGNVTAQTVDQIWTDTMDQIRTGEDKYQVFNVDLAGVTLLDSTGIGTMIKLKKRLNRRGYRLAFKNAKQNITKILEMTQLADYLLRT